jgi:hypothetical protein
MSANAVTLRAGKPMLLPRDAAAPICDPPAEEIGDWRRWAILAVLSILAFMAVLDFFIVNAALAGIGADFRASSLSATSWAAQRLRGHVRRGPGARRTYR